MKNQNQQRTPRSKYYWALMTAAAVIGVAGIYLLLAVLVDTFGRAFGLRALSILLIFAVVGGARAIDERILANSPHLVRPKDRQLLAERLGRDPLTGAPLVARYDPTPGYGQAPGQGPASTYGQMPSYNQAQALAQPAPPTQPATPAQTRPSANNGYGSGCYGPTAS